MESSHWPNIVFQMGNNFISVAEARQRILKDVTPISEWETVHLRQALGRICSDNMVSPINVPNHRNSAMDGYSLASSNLSDRQEITLQVHGKSFAGTPYNGDIRSGGCIKIMTGAVIPDGHDVILPKECVSLSADGQITFDASGAKPGQNVRFPGEDLKKGEIAVPKGKWLRPAEIGLMASLGINEVKVYRRPVIAFFSTGDELRAIGDALECGQVYDSNRYTIHAMISRMGCSPRDLGAVPDNPKALQKTIDVAEGCDAVITSGGVSVGDADYVKDMLEQKGNVLFWKIAMKPGRPFAFGKIGNALFFGLPGNPVSVMVTFYMIVLEALWRLYGRTDILVPPVMTIKTLDSIRKIPGRMEYQRCIIEHGSKGELVARTTGDQGSGILKSMSIANGLIILDSDTGNLAEGSLVQVLPLEGIV